MLGKYIMVNRIFRPHTIQGRVVTNKMKGTGMGSVLLGTDTGSGSSYTSMDDYMRTTHRGKSMGLGLGGAIQRKLESLAVKPADQKYKKRKQNINFDL